MKLSVRGEYALRALVMLGLNVEKGVIRIQAISETQNIPKRFLEQILNDLRSGGIVESRRGATGGYRLRRKADQITLAEVIRYIEGPLAPISCVSESCYEKCSCPNEDTCALRSVMREVRDSVVRILEEVTIEKLCQRARKLQGAQGGSVDYMI